MLSAAALGMFAYGFYSAMWAVLDLIRGARLELWAEVGSMVFGVVLGVSAAFVRVRLPGGLALAAGAMLGLQALAVHAAAHLGSGLGPQIARGVVAAGLLGTAYVAGNDVGTSGRRPGRGSARNARG
jgi:hypothetical protein